MIHHEFSVRDFARRFPSVQERWYVAAKLATDPLYPAVHEVLRDTAQPLLDVGCGMGILAFYLRQRGWLPAITGVDFDARKIATACSLAASFGDKLAFCRGDAGVALPAHCGSVSVLDVLQYLAPATRDVMLQQCAARVADNGVLVIRSGIRDDTLRFRFTHRVDQLASWMNWIQTPPVRYPRREELERVLGAEGLRGSFEPLWGRTPFNNWLGVFRRTAAG